MCTWMKTVSCHAVGAIAAVGSLMDLLRHQRLHLLPCGSVEGFRQWRACFDSDCLSQHSFLQDCLQAPSCMHGYRNM